MTSSSSNFEDFLSDLRALSEELNIRTIRSSRKKQGTHVSDMTFEDFLSDLHALSEELHITIRTLPWKNPRTDDSDMTSSSRNFEDFLYDLYALSEELHIGKKGLTWKNPRDDAPDMTSSTRDFAGISSDLLRAISEKLNVIELLSFRSVCKNWRSASCTSSMSTGCFPWFLLGRPNYPVFVLLATVEHELYRAVIPELKGSHCIASQSGWILVRKNPSNSLFFFYPFSRVRIDLPKILIENETESIGAFSCSPTSQDCVVCVARNDQNAKLELHVIRRGETDWTLHKQKDTNLSVEKITSMVYLHDRVHLYEGSDRLTEFSFSEEKWERYEVVPASESNQSGFKTLPYSLSMMNARNWFNSTKRRLISLDSLSTCGTLMGGECFLGEKEEVVERQSNQFRGVWIEPRFYEISGTLDW